MTGSEIFLTMTALPERDAQTSFVLKALLPSNTRRMASATDPASMMAPSTIASAGTGSMPNAVTRYPLPDGFSSTALTALDPMSSPTTVLAFPKSGIFPVVSTRKLGNGCAIRIAMSVLAAAKLSGFARYECANEARIRKRALSRKLLSCSVIGRFRRGITRGGVGPGSALPAADSWTFPDTRYLAPDTCSVDPCHNPPYHWGLRLQAKG